MSNKNLFFHLSKGNPNNKPVGLSTDKLVYGQSLGGELFRSENLENLEIIYHELKNNTQELFDPIVPSDFIKNNVNYRAIYITNLANEPFLLNEVNVSNVVKDDYVGFALTDVDIAVEGIYTISEVSRPIPNDPIKPGNPSIYLDDEYDSTSKLQQLNLLSFKKTLSANDLPAEIPNQGVLKVWIRRKMIVNKIQMPDSEALESFTLSVKEYDTNDITSISFQYTKLAGRVSLSNWFDYTITPGKGSSFLMRELLPKDVDVSNFNIVNVFSVNEKVLIFYTQQLSNAVSTLNYLLVVDPKDNSALNKYVQIQLKFQSGLESNEKYVNKTLIDIKKSFYDQNKFYFFWDEEVSINDPCTLFYFGFYQRYDRIASDKLLTHLWTDEIFVNVSAGWDNRRIESHDILDRKVIRTDAEFVNIEQIDDLFIIFSKNTRNKALLEINEINLNRNELLYIFEKDLDNSEKYSKFNNYPGSEDVFSQRLIPSSIPTLPQITSYNNAKNVFTNAIISNSSEINKDTISPRKIKYLLDGSRYVDKNSVHGREFKVGKRFVTYEFPSNVNQTTGIMLNTSFKISNDTAIYSSMKEVFGTTNTIINEVDGNIIPLAWFQQNVIDLENAGSISIPIEWADRNYKDEWIKIISTLPDTSSENSPFTLSYNFSRNIWKTTILNEDDEIVEQIHNKLSGQTLTDSTGKSYTSLIRKDLQYIIEPDHYQPLSVEINVRNVFSGQFNVSRYMIRYSVYFKGNTSPLLNITTYSKDLSNLSYIFINPAKTFNMSVNYLDVLDTSSVVKSYYLANLHNALLDDFVFNISKELRVDPQRSPNQSEFNYYRAIEVEGFVSPTQSENNSGEVVIPIVLYGNAYKNESGGIFNSNIEVKYPFDFSKLHINDKSMRIYTESNQKSPLNFKISYYDYDRDMVVLWVRLQDFGITNDKLYLYYNKIDPTENYNDVIKNYLFLKNNIYPSGFIGAWHFDIIKEDNRTSFNDGAIYEAGDPIVYEKSIDNEFRLTRIEKEYFYGLANVYKSNYFDINIDIPAEESLFFDEKTKNEFVGFIKNVANVFKPGYTEVNDVKPFGIDVLESGEGGAGMAENKKVAGLISLSANDNVNTYYERLDRNKFDLKTSFNGYSKLIDWVIAKPIDTTVFKSGVFKVSGKLKSETIKFIKPFKNTDYFLFMSSPANDKLYWNQLCKDRFTISSSHYLTTEINWMAFHRDMFGGVFTPDSIFVGHRTISEGYVESSGTTGTTGTSGTPNEPPDANLRYWYDSSLIIKPEVGEQGDPGEMQINPSNPGYSILLSSNENINMYWTEKESNQFTIKASSPVNCTIHWAVIQNGIEWWQELI